jgi:CelD/BcsL family acetyltransferase involved in cellulose biosynthesis
MVAYTLNDRLPVHGALAGLPSPAVVPREQPPAPVTVEPLDGLAALDRLEPIWNRTVERAGLTHPFACLEWVRSWAETQIDPAALRVFVARAGAEVTGIVPLVERRTGPGGCLTIRRGISCPHTPRLDFVVAARHAETWRALWHAIAPGGRTLLELQDLAEDGPTLAALDGLARDHGLPSGRRVTLQSPWIELPASWDAYQGTLKRHMRETLRSRHRRLARHGAVEFETIRSRTGLHEALDDAFELEAAAWKDSAGTAIRRHPHLVALYTRVAERAADRGWLRLQFVRVGGRRIAFGFGLQYGERLFSMKTGYDPAFASCSPGQLFFEMSIRSACEEGLTCFDLLGACDPWKLEWTRRTRSHYLLSVHPRTLPGHAAYAARYRLVPAVRRSPVYRAARELAHRMRRRRQPSAAEPATR